MNIEGQFRQALNNITKEMILTIPRVYQNHEIMIHKAHNIRRDEKGIITGVTWSGEYDYKEKIENSDSAVSKTLESPQTSQLTSEISKNKDITPEWVSEILSRYLRKQYRDGFQEKDLEQVIEDFSQEPSEWILKMKMYGVYTPEKLIEFANFRISDVTEDDLTYEDAPHLGVSKPPQIYHANIVIQFTGTWNEVQYYPQKFTTLLSLYNTSAVTTYEYRIETNSFRHWYGGTMGTFRDYSRNPILTLTPADVSSVDNFFKSLDKEILSGLINRPIKGPLAIALDRYKESLRRNELNESKITYAIMGLEALLLDDNAELAYKLRVRASKLLGFLDEDADEVSKTVQRSYGIRSSFVHGSIIQDSKQEELTQCLARSQNYLRKLILFYIQEEVISKKQKKAFIKKLDTSLINESKSNELKQKGSEIIKQLPKVF